MVINVPVGKKGAWEVGTFEVSESHALTFNERQPSACRHIVAGTYKGVSKDGKIITSNNPAEIQDQ